MIPGLEQIHKGSSSLTSTNQDKEACREKTYSWPGEHCLLCNPKSTPRHTFFSSWVVIGKSESLPTPNLVTHQPLMAKGVDILAHLESSLRRIPIHLILSPAARLSFSCCMAAEPFIYVERMLRPDGSPSTRAMIGILGRDRVRQASDKWRAHERSRTSLGDCWPAS
jgi:hypothetical protein